MIITDMGFKKVEGTTGFADFAPGAFNANVDTLENKLKTIDTAQNNTDASLLEIGEAVKAAVSGVEGKADKAQFDKEQTIRVLQSGFEDGIKTFSHDGTVITATAVDGRTLVKTFSDGFSVLTAVLTSSDGVEVARMVKTFLPSGDIEIEFIYA